MSPAGKEILSLLGIRVSPQSKDYIQDKQQYQLHSLLTEQRHQKTWNLSFTLKEDIRKGLERIFSVDEDISRKFSEMAENTASLERAAEAVARSILKGNKIYVYGCGATGRLAKVLESALWRPFWKRVKQSPEWEWLSTHIPDEIEDLFIGELTGGDRALISSLEGFEDLQLIGRLQMEGHGIQRGDVVFCITEGGETSSVIGTILAARDQYGEMTPETIEEARDSLYFIYNNPDDALCPFDRSRKVIENPAITKINLTTGPQAISGSTRMQAATSETFLMGILLEAGIFRALGTLLDEGDITGLGFTRPPDIKKRLRSFDALQKAARAGVDSLKQLTGLESETYRAGGRTIYLAKEALLSVFTDCTERSPTFRLSPLDTIDRSERKSWIQIWTEGGNSTQAWINLLGRDFRGLEGPVYGPRFEEEIQDVYLKATALESLRQAGRDQRLQYDFSLSENNREARGPRKNDLGVVICIDEEFEGIKDPDSAWSRFIRMHKDRGARVAVLAIGDDPIIPFPSHTEGLPLSPQEDIVIPIPVPRMDDPLGLNRQTLLKILLNGHSTAVMARLGRVVGNTMTHVNPSNLKLIGRATYLIQSHVNDTFRQPEWTEKYGETEPLTYAQANAVLFDTMDYVSQAPDPVSEVELSIIRILESRRTAHPVGREQALSLVRESGLETYLQRHNPRLRAGP